jgi:NAD+ synthase
VKELTIDTDATRRKLVSFLKDGFRHAGFTRGVIGLSGGVDSALSAFLAAQALGASNLLTLFMPWKDSDPLSRRHAGLVAGQLGTSHREIDISPQIEKYFELFPEADRLRRGNKMARERMAILFDHSAAFNGLVVGTSNRTETLLGYGTLFGDTACSINPLAGLLKTEVFQLAAAVGVPREIVEKAPTADLWAGQTDEDELGFAYRDVDRLLSLKLDGKLSEAELGAAGFDADFIKKVTDMVDRFEFKRKPPLVP